MFKLWILDLMVVTELYVSEYTVDVYMSLGYNLSWGQYELWGEF